MDGDVQLYSCTTQRKYHAVDIDVSHHVGGSCGWWGGSDRPPVGNHTHRATLVGKDGTWTVDALSMGNTVSSIDLIIFQYLPNMTKKVSHR